MALGRAEVDQNVSCGNNWELRYKNSWNITWNEDFLQICEGFGRKIKASWGGTGIITGFIIISDISIESLRNTTL